MILHLGTSAWVKRCVRESGSTELRAHAAKVEAMAESVALTRKRTPLHFAVFDQRLRLAAERAGLMVAP